jgi:hypothetical protein
MVAVQLFRSDVAGDVQQIRDAVRPCVTPEMNVDLLAEFTVEDVKQALESGLDGMLAIFYKHFWGVLGEKINGGDIPVGWNETIIAPIPKVKCPERMIELRLISLCNVLYKIVSKVLANRVKKILPTIISPNQSAFVPRRLIPDNMLIAYELTHYMCNKRRGAEGWTAVKLDMSKVYDRVEWSFLGAMMARLGL